jgi:hypothetical protein
MLCLCLSTIQPQRPHKVEDVLSLGEQFLVRITDVDDSSGKVGDPAVVLSVLSSLGGMLHVHTPSISLCQLSTVDC